MNPYLVIVPTYNEVENIGELIQKIFSLPLAVAILVVDDNSPDGTADAVRKLQSQYNDRLFLEQKKAKEGLGPAYIHGFIWALQQKVEYIIQMDADFSHNPHALVDFLAALIKAQMWLSDLVIPMELRLSIGPSAEFCFLILLLNLFNQLLGCQSKTLQQVMLLIEQTY